MKYICGNCKKEYEFEFRGLINPFSPILFFCEECIENGCSIIKDGFIMKEIEKEDLDNGNNI